MRSICEKGSFSRDRYSLRPIISRPQSTPGGSCATCDCLPADGYWMATEGYTRSNASHCRVLIIAQMGKSVETPACWNGPGPSRDPVAIRSGQRRTKVRCIDWRRACVWDPADAAKGSGCCCTVPLWPRREQGRGGKDSRGLTRQGTGAMMGTGSARLRRKRETEAIHVWGMR